jgi:peroxiredoxin Q/BCP
MAQLRQDYQAYADLDTVILVAGPEPPNVFQEFWQKNDLPFIGLPDPDLQILKLYGQEVNLFKLGRMPAMVLIDKGGIARFVHYGKAMSDIPQNDEVLAEIQAISEGKIPA